MGGQLIGVLVAISSLTSMNSTMIVGARTNYAVARDWPVFAFMGSWQGERNTPAVGFIVQAAIALALIVFGAMEKDGFSTMVEFTAPVFWFFFMLSGIALFVLRRSEPADPRPFRVPLYPVLPLDLRADLRVPVLFERHARAIAECRLCRARGDGERRGRAACRARGGRLSDASVSASGPMWPGAMQSGCVQLHPPASPAAPRRAA